MNILGWRKMSAWLLIFAYVCWATYKPVPIPDNAVEIIKWSSGFFFGANAAKAGFTAIASKLAS